jgi:hypothetical protein
MLKHLIYTSGPRPWGVRYRVGPETPWTFFATKEEALVYLDGVRP